MKATSIERELQKAVSFETDDDEGRQAYLMRLIETIDELSDDDFGNLSEAAQEWCALASKAVLASKSIPDFPKAAEPADANGEDKTRAERRAARFDRMRENKKAAAAEEPEADEPEEEQEEAEPAPRKAARRQQVEEEPETEADEEPAPQRKQRVARPVGTLPIGSNKFVQEILARNPNASVKEIVAAFEHKGMEVPSRLSLSTWRSGMRSALETLNRLGMLKEPVELESGGRWASSSKED